MRSLSRIPLAAQVSVEQKIIFHQSGDAWSSLRTSQAVDPEFNLFARSRFIRGSPPAPVRLLPDSCSISRTP